MKLHILFGQRKQDYDGQYAPEALECWDEYCIDENPGGFEEACEKRLQACGEDSFSSTRVIIVNVNGGQISDLLNKAPEIAGDIEPRACIFCDQSPAPHKITRLTDKQKAENKAWAESFKDGFHTGHCPHLELPTYACPECLAKHPEATRV